MVPNCVARLVSQDADIPSAEGSAVAGWAEVLSPGPAPAGPFVILNAGMPRRGIACTSRGCAEVSIMWICRTFSSSVIDATSALAR